jgi:transmembrane sensor
MSSANDRVRELISEEAAEWFVANREGLTTKERQSFAAWLRTSPMHVEEYLAHAVIARDLHKACAYSEEALGDLLARARTSPDLTVRASWWRQIEGWTQTGTPIWQRAGLFAATCAAAAGIGWIALRGVWPIKSATPSEAVAEIHMSTRHGEQRSRRLADNSVLHLNTNSDATIRYSNKERLVILHAGEADFEVVHDTGRAFRVLAGAAQVIDVGTKFDVLLGRDKTIVTVVEGEVAVSGSMSVGLDTVAVNSDHQVTVVNGIWPPAQPFAVDAQRATAWLHRQIVFDHEPLEKVAAEFNRYAPKPIEIMTPGLQKLEISGAFSTDNPAAFIAFLRSLDNVWVEETATQIRVSSQPK